MTWSDFETRLFEMITDLPSRTVLIIGARDDQGKTGLPFVQFAGLDALYGGNADIVAEICGENVPKDMATFTAQQRNDLERLGFAPAEDGSTTWRQNLPWPTPEPHYHEHRSSKHATPSRYRRHRITRSADLQGMALPRQNTRIGARLWGHESSYPRTRYSARVKDQDDSQETCFPKTSTANTKAVNA